MEEYRQSLSRFPTADLPAALAAQRSALAVAPAHVDAHDRLARLMPPILQSMPATTYASRHVLPDGVVLDAHKVLDRAVATLTAARDTVDGAYARSIDRRLAELHRVLAQLPH